MTVSAVLSPAPFGGEVAYLDVRAGTTVRALLREAVAAGAIALDDLDRATLYVDGDRIARDVALSVVLEEGQTVNIVVEPLGGGGGGRKNALQIVLQIAVIAAAAWVGGSAAVVAKLGSQMAARVAAAAVMTLGNAAVAALFKPASSSAAPSNDRYALQTASNQYRPWGPQPLALGEVVVAPDQAVKTFTRSEGEDVWIYGILGLHRGACQVSELKIGDTLVSSMGPADARFVEHLTPGPRTFSLYPFDTDQLDLQEELEATTSSATPVYRVASSEGERFEFDFFLPQGLFFAKDDGRKLTASVTVTIRYRAVDENGTPIGGGGYQSGLTFTLSAATNEPWRVMRSLDLPLGRYEFEVQRSTLPDTNEKRRTDIAWTAVRAVAFRKPVADEVLSVIEFAVRATAINQGTLAPITCRIVPLVETWDPEADEGAGAWTEPRPSSNPAALTRWLLAGPAPARPLPDDQVDARLRRWSELCDQYAWSAHYYLTDVRKQDQVLIMLSEAGRSSGFWDGRQMAASPWVEKPVPRQLFAGTNLSNHRRAYVYAEPVHALRVEFNNLDQAGAPDEIYVYADGYGAVADGEVQAASLVESLRLEGQRTESRAYRDGRWELGRRKHLRRVDTWQTDIEHLTAMYGDRVRLAWNRVGGGVGARVRCRRWAGDLVSGLRLDQPVEMEAGKDYAVDLRLPNQVLTGVPIVTVPGQTREIVFAAPRGAEVSPRGGDRIAFGELELVSEDVEILGVQPGEGHTAQLTGARYVAPLLMAGETGPIPDLPQRLSRDRAKDPPAPALLGLQVDANGVRVGFAMPPWRGSPLTGFSARWRPRPLTGQETGWVSLPDLGAGAMTLITPPLRELPGDYVGAADTTQVDIELRALTASGRISPALAVTAVLPTVGAANGGDWTLEPRPADPGGTQQPGLILSRAGPLPLAPLLRVDFGHYGEAIGEGEAPPAFDPSSLFWFTAYDGPMASVLPIDGLKPDQTYYVRLIQRSEQRVEGPPDYLGPVTTPGLTTNVDPEQLETAVNAAVAAATAALEAADASLQAAMIVVQEAQAALSAALGAAETSLQAAIDAVDTKADGIQSIVTSQGLVLAGKASQTALDAQISRIDTSLASIGTINATLADLPNHYASASQFLSIKSEVEAARGGSANLSGRFSTLATAITDGLALKVDVSAFNALLARVTATEGDITSLEGSVSSAQSAIADLAAGKVNLSDFNGLSATVTAQGLTISGHGSRLTTIEAALPGKVNLSDFTTLSGTVTAHGLTISGHASRLTTVELALPGKVDLTDFSTLSGTVTSQGLTLAGHADRLTAVEIDVAGKVAVSVTDSISARLNSGGDVYASIVSAASVAATADGKASAVIGWNLDVSGRAVGLKFANDGTTGALDILTDYVTFRSLDVGAGYIRVAGGNLKVFSAGGVDVVTIGIV